MKTLAGILKFSLPFICFVAIMSLAFVFPREHKQEDSEIHNVIKVIMHSSTSISVVTKEDNELKFESFYIGPASASSYKARFFVDVPADKPMWVQEWRDDRWRIDFHIHSVDDINK